MKVPDYVYANAFAYVFIMHCIYGAVRDPAPAAEAGPSGSRRAEGVPPLPAAPSKKRKLNEEEQKGRLLALVDQRRNDTVTALQSEGVLIPDFGKQWYKDNVQPKMSNHEFDILLETLGWTSADDTVLFTDLRTPDDARSLYRKLSEKGLLDGHDRDWYANAFRPPHGASLLYEVLKAKGLVSADPGLQWYVDAFGTTDFLARALKDANLLHTCDYPWFLETYKGVFNGPRTVPIITALKEAGKYNATPGADFYREALEHFGPCVLLMVMRELDMLSGDLPLEWYANSFQRERSTLIAAIREAGVVDTAGMDLDGRNYMRDQILGLFDDSRIRLQVLDLAGLLNQDVSAGWYAAVFGKARVCLAKALASAGYA